MTDPSTGSQAAVGDEIARGGRFRFGENWQRFLANVDEARIQEAVSSLSQLLAPQGLSGRRFLDVGSGSGLSSLAARRLGATVLSFDNDPQSVAATKELRERYDRDDEGWRIVQASVLDEDRMRELGSWDIVHAWGVLHHTGDLWRALENVLLPLGGSGTLVVAVYNDQGLRSRLWRIVKKVHCSGALGRLATIAAFFPFFAMRFLAVDLARGEHPLRRYREYQRRRGMSVKSDWVDWLGGLPYEVARPDDLVAFFSDRGLHLARERRTRTLGNNQFVFEKLGDSIQTPKQSRY